MKKQNAPSEFRRGVLYQAYLDVSFHQLAANLLKGKDCSEIRSGFREFNVGSHVIFYRQIITDTIEIVRVLHGSMDIETWLFAPEDSGVVPGSSILVYLGIAQYILP